MIMQAKCDNQTPLTYGGHSYDCVADGVYRRDDGMVTFDSTKARYAWEAQQKQQQQSGNLKTLAGVLIGGLVLGGGLYLLLRD